MDEKICHLSYEVTDFHTDIRGGKYYGINCSDKKV